MLKSRITALGAISLIAAAWAAEAGVEARATAPTVPSSLDYKFEIGMVRGSIWNPWTLTNDQVELRSYRGAGIRDGGFVAPPIRVKPGQTLRIQLDNRMPACTTSAEGSVEPCHNDTNLHTHGLWVSPAGNSDNVMISIPPGRRFDYEYRIPDEHPAGTFWYHPHRHGSGMFQVGSGMAGALIVEGSRPPTADRPGDIDVLLKDAKGRAFPERVLVLQTIPYACSFDEDGWPHFARDESGKRTGPLLCASGEIGRIDDALQFKLPPVGAQTGRFVSINGKVQPVLGGPVSGRFERWRFVQAGSFGFVRLRFRRLAAEAPLLSTVRASEQEQWITRYCPGPDLPSWQLAHDGLTLSEIRQVEESVISPGERLDLLTWFPEPGRYCMLSQNRGADVPTSHRVLALVDVGGGPKGRVDPTQALRQQLMRAANRALPGTRNMLIRNRVIADLNDGMRLGAFAWHRPIGDSELTGHQVAVFRTEDPEGKDIFLIDERKFDHERVDRYLPLGGIEEWRLSVPANGGPHQFHIHVNPFQVISISNEKGEDVTDPNSPGYNPDFAGAKGQWRDNIRLIPGNTVIMRTRYERFIGDFMLHCHILKHADEGMAQYLRIYVPGSVEGTHKHH